MKKYTAAIFVLIFAFSAFQLKGFAQSADEPSLFSFRGVLAGILEEVKSEAENIPSPFFKGEAPAANENNFSFVILGDTQRFDAGNPNGNLQRVVKSVVKKNPALVVVMGDLVGSGDNYTDYTRRFGEWKGTMAPLLSKTYAAMGNHDNVDEKGEKAWQEAFDFPTNGPGGYSETVYSFDFKNSHFVFLNSDHEKEHLVNSNQRAWLEQDLARNKKENIFVIVHEPAYPVSDKGGEGLDVDPAERNALWQILEKHKVTAVFSGHEHIVSRRKIGNTYQFVFGSTDSFDHGLPAAGVAEYANQGQGRFGIVEVSGKKITVNTFSPEDKELNSFTFSK